MSERDRTTGWRNRWARLLDWIYPAECALCRSALYHGLALCDDCAIGLPLLRAPFCSTCGLPFEGLVDRPSDCPNCSKQSFRFEFAKPAMIRDSRTLDLIHRLKYGREIHLADALAGLAVHAFGDPRFADALAARWPLVPVPLHRSKIRQRHFNQAAEIARGLSARTGLPQLDALARIRSTDTQTRLGRGARMNNLKGAFDLTRRGRRWLELERDGAILVDDVLTTGSTLHECAKVLRKAGVRKVVAVVVMRG
jgi:competence protein ComFC